jgi:NAD(P)-dependent dehydrogenase (short-subunit alcohol dehydrogenase family)
MNGVAVVTGGSRGIGRSVCLEAAARGYDVVFGYRSAAEAAAQLVRQLEQLGRRAVGVQDDLVDDSAVHRLADAARAAGPVSLLVNNAGVTNSGPFHAMTQRAWDHALALNLTAPTLLAQALAPDLGRTRGSIINIGSTAAFMGSVHSVPYGVTKSGVVGLTRTLAGMLAPDVRVNAVCPGPIETELLDASLTTEHMDKILASTPLNRLGTCDEVARVVLDVASWPYCTGQSVVVDGGRAMH